MGSKITGDLLKIFNHCVSAVLPENLIRKCLQYNTKTQQMTVVDKIFNIQNNNIYIAGTGKAVLNMAKETELILGSKIKKGIVSVPAGSIEKNEHNSAVIDYIEGAKNNLPDVSAETTAKKIKNLAHTLGPNDILLVLISGGGSALLPLPQYPVTLEDKLSIIKKLGNAGADIKELNTVRKKLSALKGGKLAMHAQPAQVVSLILSDIVGDPLDLIASGPTCKNEDDPKKAMDILKQYKLYNNLPDQIKDILNDDTSSCEFPDSNVINYIIGSNKLSTNAAVVQAKILQYLPIQISNTISGNIKTIAKEYGKLTVLLSSLMDTKVSVDVAKDMLKNIDIPNIENNWINNVQNKDKICLIFGGETTVEVKGSGKGGRNQQLALEFSKVLHENKNHLKSVEIYFLSAGTDGIDGPTDAAGAIGYTDLVNEAIKDGLDVDKYINENDSYNFYKAFRNGEFHVITGHTNTNVMDIHLIAIRKC